MSRAAFALAFLLLAARPPAQAGEASAPLPGSVVAEGTGRIAQAWLTDPTGRYDHFVLGADFEAARLVVRTREGHVVSLVLPENEVFEDRVPRLADLDGDGQDEIVLVRSHRRTGTDLVVIALVGETLQIVAHGPSTGAPHRWLNPVPIADYDGDGRLDVAYVQQPHVVGLLRVFTLDQGKLKEIASFPGVSNHVAGLNAQGLSAAADFDGDGITDLAVPSLDRRRLLFISFRGTPHLIGQAPLPRPAASNFALTRADGRPVVDVGLSGGNVLRVPAPPERAK
ncbi:VCBS repeat-containing protein [Aquabacter sp. L1I39]|uniref:FG-GAP repeat domain-containing protein n=1 Tax=Aquabacter sp. L1I39 TaxID=2820278 RepID=UPI001ADCD067|nr:VCBS repeat-containing protein [Aquabacter sp. L1I39]QTL01984.1 VCBS repeat-containing protein [Aquabacter sp. L1I39]